MPITGPPFVTLRDGVFSATQPGPEIPDDLSIYDFLTTFEHEHRPPRQGAVLFKEPSGKEYRYEEVVERTEALARAFRAELDLGRDDVIGIFSPNDVAFPIACWATFRCGAIVSPANPTYSAPELAHQLNLVKEYYPLKALLLHPASLAVGLDAAKKIGIPNERVFLLTGGGDTKGLKTLEELIKKHSEAKEVEKQRFAKGEAQKRLAFLSCSSGTTGLPKAIAISHRAVVANILQGFEHYRGDIRPREDSVLGVLPFYHIYGLVVVLHLSIYHTMPLTVFPSFQFKAVLEAITKQRITMLYIVPPMVLLFAKQPLVDDYDLSHVRTAMVGAAPLGEDLVKAFRKRLPNILLGQGYGMTETSTLVTMPPYTLGLGLPGASAGILVPHLKAKIVDPTSGKLLGFGQRGELCTSSPSNASFYLGNEKATQETFREGFVFTGDEGYFDEQGMLYITDRIKELIKVKGLQVAPAELEDCVIGHQDVADVCVVSIEDDYSGELPRAYVVLTEAAQKRVKDDDAAAKKVKDSIYDFVKEHKSKAKWLDGGVEFTDLIPKNPSGKLLRRVLRDKARAEKVKPKL